MAITEVLGNLFTTLIYGLFFEFAFDHTDFLAVVEKLYGKPGMLLLLGLILLGYVLMILGWHSLFRRKAQNRNNVSEA